MKSPSSSLRGNTAIAVNSLSPVARPQPIHSNAPIQIVEIIALENASRGLIRKPNMHHRREDLTEAIEIEPTPPRRSPRNHNARWQPTNDSPQTQNSTRKKIDKFRKRAVRLKEKLNDELMHVDEAANPFGTILQSTYGVEGQGGGENNILSIVSTRLGFVEPPVDAIAVSDEVNVCLLDALGRLLSEAPKLQYNLRKGRKKVSELQAKRTLSDEKLQAQHASFFTNTYRLFPNLFDGVISEALKSHFSRFKPLRLCVHMDRKCLSLTALKELRELEIESVGVDVNTRKSYYI